MNNEYVARFRADTSGVIKDLQQVGKTQSIRVKVRADGTKEMETLVKTFEDTSNKAKVTTREVTKFDKTGKQLGTTLVSTSKNVETLGARFVDVTKKVVAFGGVTAIIGLFTQGVIEAIQAVKDIDDALVEFRKVSDLSGESLTEYTQKLAEMSEITGSTLSGMIEASTEFKKSGFTEDESATLASVAEMYRNIADEEISAGESASFIISQMKAFNIEANNSEHIIDAVNEVSNKYAVSSADLANNLGKVSATLATNGVTYEQTLGMMTAITEVTRNASTASRGLRQISSRLVQTLDESSSTGKKLTDIYNGLGISLKDNEGQLRSTYDILYDLSLQWDSLSKNERDYIALTSAGANQVQNFSALMQNFSQAVKATDTAMNSSGSAMEENEKAMDSLDKKAQVLKSQFQQLVWGDGGLNSLLKGFLDVGIAILKFANSDVGQLIIKLTLVTIALNGVQKGFVLLKNTNVISYISILTKSFEDLFIHLIDGYTATESLKKSFSGLASSVNLPILAITALVGFIGLVIKKAKEAENSFEEHNKKLKELGSEYKDAENKVSNIEEELKKVEDRIKEINELPSISITEEGELNSLQRQKAELTSTLEIEKERLRVAKEQAEIQAQQILNEKVKNKYTEETTSAYVMNPMGVGGISTVRQDTDIVTALRDASNEMMRQQEIINNLNEVKEKNGKLTEEESTQLDNAVKYYNEASSVALDYSDKLQGIVDSTDKHSESNKKAQSALDEYSNILTTLGEKLKDTTDSEGNFVVSEEDEIESTENAKTALQEVSDQLKDLQSNYDTLSSVVQDYNDDGVVSMETLENLLNLGSEYLQYLSLENGQLTLNEDAMKAMANAQIDKAEADLIESTQAKLTAIANGELSDSEIDAGNSALSAIPNINNIISAIKDLGNESDVSANKVHNLQNALGSYSFSSEKAQKEADKVTKSFASQYKVLESARGGFGKYSASTSKSAGSTRDHTSATNENTKALKAQAEALKTVKEELDNQVKEYEKVISYINSKIDSEIDKIEELKDKAVDAIKAQIDALKEQRDAEEQYWDDKINALKDQNDALEDQIEYERLLEALEKAKSQKVKVYREGQGYVYEQDQSAVNEARQNIIEFNRKKQQEQELKELEDLKNSKLKNYDQQIKDLEDYQKKVEKKYDDQIKYYKDWKDKFKEQVNAYETEQNRLKALQLTGIDFEKEGWQTRLGNLDSFVSNYTAKLKELQRATEEYNKAQQAYNLAQSQAQSSGGGAVGGSSNTSTPSATVSSTTSKPYTVYRQMGIFSDQASAVKVKNEVKKQYPDYEIVVFKDVNNRFVVAKKMKGAYANISGLAQAQNKMLEMKKKYPTNTYNIRQFASGISSIKDDQLAIVGENPYKEIVLGSKLNSNNGVLTSMSKGSGVVNAKSTKTLAGLLNQLGGMNIGNSYPTTNNSNSTHISIGNISLPQVKNGSDFVDYLQNFSLDMKQKTFAQ